MKPNRRDPLSLIEIAYSLAIASVLAVMICLTMNGQLSLFGANEQWGGGDGAISAPHPSSPPPPDTGSTSPLPR